MATPSELLRRFRFHVVPGAPAAVPASVDRAGELAAEAAPVFAALDEAQTAAAAIVARSERDAAAARTRALEHGQRLVADARAGCAAARVGAAAQLLADAAGERERVLAGGRAEADRIGRVAAERMPALIDEIVQRVLAGAMDPGLEQRS